MRPRMHPYAIVAAAIVAALALAGTAVAGNWAQVRVTEVPADPPAGETTTIELRVLQHGETAVSWPALTVIATHGGTGDVVRAEARPEGPAGRYMADLILPAEGDWALSFDSDDLYMEGGATLRVIAPPIALAATGTTEAPSGSIIAAMLGALALVSALAIVLAARGRRRVEAGPLARGS